MLLDGELPGVLMRRAAKRDTTEPEIVDALQKFGCKVRRLSDKGLADLLIKAPDGSLHLVECKTPGGRLTPEQVEWFTWWGDVAVVDSAEKAVKWLIGSRRRMGAPS